MQTTTPAHLQTTVSVPEYTSLCYQLSWYRDGDVAPLLNYAPRHEDIRARWQVELQLHEFLIYTLAW